MHCRNDWTICKLEITATAAEVPNPGEKVRLRLVLVEEAVRYVGANQARFHHHIVRDLPGGAAGVPLKAKTGKQQATVDLAQLRANVIVDDVSARWVGNV